MYTWGRRNVIIASSMFVCRVYRCYAALGDVAKVKYLREVGKLADKMTLETVSTPNSNVSGLELFPAGPGWYHSLPGGGKASCSQQATETSRDCLTRESEPYIQCTHTMSI